MRRPGPSARWPDRRAVTRFRTSGYWRSMTTKHVSVALALASVLTAAGCSDNGNDVGYQDSEAGTGGSGDGGSSGGTGASSGGSSSGGAGGGGTTGGAGIGGVGAGGVTGGSGGATGGAGEGTGGESGGSGGADGGSAGFTGGTAGTTGGFGGAGGATGGTAGVGGAGGVAGATGGDGGAGGQCAPLPSCNWCGGDLLRDASGCVTGYVCLNGIDPCETSLQCSTTGICSDDEYCGDDGLCWPDPVTYLNVGEFAYVGNPCTTDPCLPGVVAAVRELGETYVISVDGHWVDDTYDWETNFPEVNPLPSQTVMASGKVTYHTDDGGGVYMEIELTTLTNRLF